MPGRRNPDRSELLLFAERATQASAYALLILHETQSALGLELGGAQVPFSLLCGQGSSKQASCALQAASVESQTNAGAGT